jgi:hypothetical protein
MPEDPWNIAQQLDIPGGRVRIEQSFGPMIGDQRARRVRGIWPPGQRGQLPDELDPRMDTVDIDDFDLGMDGPDGENWTPNRNVAEVDPDEEFGEMGDPGLRGGRYLEALATDAALRHPEPLPPAGGFPEERDFRYEPRMRRTPINKNVYLDSRYAPDTDIDLPTDMDVHNMQNWGVNENGEVIQRDLGTVLEGVDQWSRDLGNRPMRVDLTPGGVHISDMGAPQAEPLLIPERFGQGKLSLDDIIFQEQHNRYMAQRPDLINSLTDTAYDRMVGQNKEGYARRISPKPVRMDDWAQEPIYQVGDFTQSAPYPRFFQAMKQRAIEGMRELPGPITENQMFLDILKQVLKSVDPRRKAQILQRFGLGALAAVGGGALAQEEEGEADVL